MCVGDDETARITRGFSICRIVQSIGCVMSLLFTLREQKKEVHPHSLIIEDAQTHRRLITEREKRYSPYSNKHKRQTDRTPMKKNTTGKIFRHVFLNVCPSDYLGGSVCVFIGLSE